MMTKNSKIYIAGHNGMVGRSLTNELGEQGYSNLIYKTSKELDLKNQNAVEKFFEKEKPEYVFLLAAKVGGIKANMSFPAEFLYDNLLIESNVIHNAYKNGVKKLLFLGSSCIYPRESLQPMKEEYLLNGKLEPTNEGYALAKIVGIKLCDTYRKQYGSDFISIMPPNLYGIGDNFDLNKSHVIAALIRRFHEAKKNNVKTISIWGSGNARREFLYVTDLVGACIFYMKNYSQEGHINIGVGEDVSIKELSYVISKIIGFKGEILFDTTKPDGMPKKLMDVTKMKRWEYQNKISLKEGIKTTYFWARKNKII